MLIDNVTWQAKVGIFSNLKLLFKTETKSIGMLHFLLYYTLYSLYLFLTFILTMQVNIFFYASRRTVKKNAV